MQAGPRLLRGSAIPMPVYPTICGCGHRGEVFALMRDAHALKCPCCGRECQQDFEAKFATITVRSKGPKSWTKGRSRQWDFIPKEAARARSIVSRFGGSDLADCIKMTGSDEDGKVYFKSPSQARRFNAAWAKFREHHQAKAAATHKPRKGTRDKTTPRTSVDGGAIGS